MASAALPARRLPGSVVLREVDVGALDPARLEPVIGAQRMAAFDEAATVARELLDGRAVINVNSTAAGGGVAEMLQTLLAYTRGIGIDTRWMVIEGDPRFFEITKRIHNHLYGAPGDGGPLGAAERAHYESILRANGEELRSLVKPGDVLLLHDPQTAALASLRRELGAKVVWRCHVGRDTPNEHTQEGWEFLRPYLEDVDAYVFSRRAFAPVWADPARLHVIPPSIDPFSAKNQALPDEAARAILQFIGLAGGTSDPEPVHFRRRDGSPGRIDRRVDILQTGPPPPPEAPLVVQLSRWDRMKDMQGVMLAFAEHVDRSQDAHLALVGPAVHGVADDSEAAQILQECIATWRALPHAARTRVHLACVPMHDPDEAALIVNAIQRHATVVTQKSIAEGFGLTVAEAMWKNRPIVASRVGGIPDQIVHGEHGLLVDDPHDLAAFGAAVTSLLHEPRYAERLGGQAHRRANEQLLGDRHLERWGEVFASL